MLTVISGDELNYPGGLNGEPLAGKGHYPSYIACNVCGKGGTFDFVSFDLK